MIIKCLIENLTSSESFQAEHGLSLYIKTEKHQILFDFGSSSQMISNANKLDVDLEQIDLGFLSHGHYDHGGGMKSLLNINQKVKICVHQKAFEKHVSERSGNKVIEIGIDKTLIDHDQICYVGNHMRLDNELFLFSDVKGRTLVPIGNQAMYVYNTDGSLIQDRFFHEQNLIIEENGKFVLFAGCAHRGIVNIVERAADYIGKMPDIVIGGFHLHSREAHLCESNERVKALGEILLKTGAQYYTCHCTGITAYETLKSVMGEQVVYFSTGQTLNI